MCRQCGSLAVAGRNHSKVIGRDPIVQVSKTWALTCPETVQRPCMTREMETWLSDSRVGNNSVVDHRSWRPVLSPLRNCVDRCHVWPYWASRCKPWRWMLRHQHTQANLDGLRWFEAYIVSWRFATYRRRCNIAEHWQPWELRGLHELGSWVSMRYLCTAGTSPHWIAVFCDWVA